MTISFKHAFTSAKADGTDSTLIQPSNWNAEHVITLAAAKVLGRDSSSPGAVQELPLSFDPSGQSMIPPSGTTAQRPSTALAGMLRYSTSLTRFEFYNGTSWGLISGGATVAASAPSTPQTGDLWYDSTNSVLKTWNGSSWSAPTSNSSTVRQTFVATAGQTSFTVTGGYAAGFIDVFQNGVKLVNGTDVTVTSGVSVVLATGAAVGDVVEVIGLASAGATYLSTSGGTLSGTLNGTSAAFSGTVSDGSGTMRPLISGTAQASTSGTSIDFTGIPSWAKRITVMLNGVSTNGTSALILQVGSATISVSGYNGQAWTGTGGGVITNGMPLTTASAAAASVNAVATLTLFNGNTWAFSALTGVASSTNNGYHAAGMGPALGGALDRVRLTTVNGTDTFDAGSVNILYE